jgi:hypothetical protein
MPDVLIRDIPKSELDELKAAAAARNVSLQSYLLDALHAQVAYARRQATLTEIGQQVAPMPAVPESEREAVLDEMKAAVEGSGTDLIDR